MMKRPLAAYLRRNWCQNVETTDSTIAPTMESFHPLQRRVQPDEEAVRLHARHGPPGYGYQSRWLKPRSFMILLHRMMMQWPMVIMVVGILLVMAVVAARHHACFETSHYSCYEEIALYYHSYSTENENENESGNEWK